MIGKKEIWDLLLSLRTEDMERADTDYKNGYLDAITDIEEWVTGHWEEMA